MAHRRAVPIVLAQPLEERVDKAGQRQLADPEGARASRDRARAGEDTPGWWWFDGTDWSYHGSEDPPA